MKVVRAECWPVRMALEEPYRIAYERVSEVANVFVRLVTDGRAVGWGCAAPGGVVTGESAEAALEALEERAAPLLRGVDPLARGAALERLGSALAGRPAALAAVDMALLDLVGKAAGLPLWRLLGGRRPRVPTSVTIGIVPVEEAVESARARLAAGFSILKLKGGRSPEEDLERLRRVREVAGPEVALRFDPNQGYTLEQAIRVAESARDVGIELYEQPTPADEPGLLGELRRRLDVPVAADESAVDLGDAVRLAADGAVDVVNVKLMKIGGITPALAAAAAADALDVPTMIGCMDESALAIAAGLAVAAACPAVRYADLDGHLGLEGDPAAGALELRDGSLAAPERPGLGVEPRE